MGAVITLPRPGRFEEILGRFERAPEPEVAAPTERFELRTGAGGYRIFDHGELIATFHGRQLTLAAKLLRLLQADDERTDPPTAA